MPGQMYMKFSKYTVCGAIFRPASLLYCKGVDGTGSVRGLTSVHRKDLPNSPAIMLKRQGGNVNIPQREMRKKTLPETFPQIVSNMAPAV
jgi:hypothetical protein